jgi:hypothetical protein
MDASVHKQTHMRGTGRYHVERDVVGAVAPAAFAQPGTEKGFLEMAMKTMSVMEPALA